MINLSGSLLLRLVNGLAAGSWLSAAWRLTLASGLLGGYTTFSTASYETVRLAQRGRWTAVLANGLGMLMGPSCSPAWATPPVSRWRRERLRPATRG